MQISDNKFKKNKEEKKIFENNIFGKSLPHNSEAEKAVLGAILLNEDNIFNTLDNLHEEDFYVLAHKTIFKNIKNLVNKNTKVDLITLQDSLEKNNELEQVGGMIFLVSLQEEITALGMVEHYCKIIKSKSILRELIKTSMDIIANCYNQGEDDIDFVIDEAEKKILKIISNRTNNNFVQLNIWLKKTFEHLSSIKTAAKGITGIPTQFKMLNKLTSGFQKSDLIIVAARPSMGKSSLALNFASNAIKMNYAVGFFSLEMSAEQLVLRLLSFESGIDHKNIRNSSISSEEWVELTHIAAEMADLKLFIDDTPGLTILELRSRARQLKIKYDIELIVIDYLQLIHVNKKYENRHQEVSEISRALKALAKELNIPIIALSQLSRAVDLRNDKRPILSDLRESGAIEQDADLIMFLYREVVYNPEADNADLSELIIGKQRNGPTGIINLNFIKELTKFEDII